MYWSLLFALAIVLTLVLKYAIPRKEHCPQCLAVRESDQPLCRECGWIYEVPGEEDDDYGDGGPEKVSPWN